MVDDLSQQRCLLRLITTKLSGLLTRVGSTGTLTMTGQVEYLLNQRRLWTHVPLLIIHKGSNQPQVHMMMIFDRRLLGINFDKHSPRDYFTNCVAYHGTLESPTDCRWGDCHLTSNLRHQQMTVAIYVR